MVQSCIDKWGIDPLKYPVFDQVDASVKNTMSIDAALEGNPQKVAFLQFQDNSFYEHILIANALAHPSELKAGQIEVPLKTPSIVKRKLKKVTL